MKNFSIIIPAYNSQDWIEECLDSIENQTHFKDNDYEIIIGIDACINTLNKIKKIWHKYKNLKVFLMKKNMGCYVIRNTIIPKTKYNNIIIFDSDDIMKNNMVEIIYETIKKNEDIDVLRYKYMNFNKEFKDENIIKTIPYFHTFGTIFIKKRAFEKMGGFVDWICAGDSEFIARGNNKIKIGCINNILLYRRHSNSNLTNNELTGVQSFLRQIQKLYIRKISKLSINKKIFKTITNKY